jgi:hypothetical protein
MFDKFWEGNRLDNLDISEEEYLEKEFNSSSINSSSIKLIEFKLFIIQHLVDRESIGTYYIKEYYIQWIFHNLLEKFGMTFDTNIDPLIKYLTSLRDKITNIYKNKEKELKESKEYKMKFVMDQLNKLFQMNLKM